MEKSDQGLLAISEVFALIRELFQERIPFNKVLGLNITELSARRIALAFDMQPSFIGNSVRQVLHGGVISSALDVIGGLTAFTAVVQSQPQWTRAALLERFAAVGTIDLRVDYLRPGNGTRFEATGNTLRIGRKVAVTRMELYNQDQALLAVGTGAYVVA